MSDLAAIRAQILDNAYVLSSLDKSLRIILWLGPEARTPRTIRPGLNHRSPRFADLQPGYCAEVIRGTGVALCTGPYSVSVEEAYLGLLDELAIAMTKRRNPFPPTRPDNGGPGVGVTPVPQWQQSQRADQANSYVPVGTPR